MLAISNFKALKRLLILFSAVLAPAGFAQNNYVAFELNRENNWDQLITEDVNGDGAKDIIFAHFDPNIGRELHIHHQQSDGNFTSNPQRIEIKTEIIAVGSRLAIGEKSKLEIFEVDAIDSVVHLRNTLTKQRLIIK